MKASIPFLALGFGLTFGVIASSCGPSRPPCTPTSCTGCCDNTTGACITITSSAQCGQRGETCKACGLGESCTFGACSGGTIGTTGGGSAGGGSAGGGSAGGGFGGGTAGGFGGGFAGGAGGGFSGGVAGGAGGGSACDGCLLPNGACRQRNSSQQTDAICGEGGLPCRSCVGTANPVCSNGMCVGGAGGGFAGGASGGGFAGGAGGGAPPSCNSATCFDGCCNGTACVRAPANGNAQTCGFGGQACENCALSGQTCNLVTLTCQSGAGGGAGGGFGGGGAGGGFAGGAAGGLPGDTCATVTPVTLSAFSALVNGSLVGFTNDTTACSGTGPDAVWSVVVPQSGSLTVTVTANGFAPRVSVRSTCTTSATLACGSLPSGSTVTTTTSTLSPGTYFLWVDSDAAPSFNTYSLQVNFQPSGAGGGGAGGGGPIGGGSAGGAAPGYTVSSIIAACDDLTVGATDLLSASTSPMLRDDSATPALAVPIGSFPFYGASRGFYGVQSNGMVQFFDSLGGSVSTEYMNAAFPTVNAPPLAAAPYWDDLYLSSVSMMAPGATVRQRTFTSGGSRFTVAWRDVAQLGAEFQAKFFATGVIEFHYCNMGTLTGSGASTGLQGPTSTIGTPAVLPTPLTGSGLRFTP